MQAIEQFLAVAAVFSLLGAALWFARRKGALLMMPVHGSRQKTVARVAQRIPLTAQHCLHVVETDGAVLLIGTHPGGMVFAPQTGAFALELHRACSNGSEETR